MNRKETRVFIELVKAGLWEKEVRLLPFGEIDYAAILKLAEEQSVVGLVAAGLEHVTDVKAPQEWALQFAGQTIQLEQRNKAMNAFIAKLIEDLRKADVYTLLVKGQGVAQCYERPLWRACGDVDLLLSKENYEKAKAYLKTRASHIEEEDEGKMHLGLTIDGWLVELHGTLYTCFSKRINRLIDYVQASIFCGGEVRSWDNNGTSVYLPSPDNDVILVFTHIMEHFFIEGVGLRQICDWSRLLYTYRESLNYGLLEKRIRKVGIMTEWKAFASLAVDSLGMPAEAMPFYDERFKAKGEKVLRLVMEAGNFGHNKDLSYRTRYKGVAYKVVSLWRRIWDFARFVPIFPKDSVSFFFQYLINKV